MPTAAQLLRLARHPGPAPDPTAPADTELLRRYAAARDEDAFAELVRRNGPLVLRACRHVLGESAADDAFQATFLLLARSTRRLTKSGSLAGWLHAAAVRIARNARRGEDRRKRREADRRASPVAPDEMTWREVREILDAEIAALPECDRLPVVLCYVRELSYEEAARQAGCPVGTLRNRLDRGKERLRKRLARYGLPLAAPVLVLGGAPPVSAALVEAAVGVVRSGMAGKAPPALASLLPATGRVRIALLLAPLAAVGAVLAAAGRPAGDPPVAEPPRPATAAAAPPAPADALGDPLPPGALARLGSARFHHGQNLSRVIVGADGRLVASEAGYASYKLWDGETGRPVPLWDGLLTKPGEEPIRFALTPAGGRLAAVVWDAAGSRLLDPATGEAVRALPPLDGRSVAELAPDGKTVAALRRDFTAPKVRSTLRVWRADAGGWTDFDTDPGPPGGRAVQFSADSKRFAYCASGSAVAIWEVATAKTLLRLPATAQQFLEAVALSPDGKLLAKEDRAAGKVRVWDVDAGTELPELPDQPEKLGQALAFSPDGRTLAGVVQPITIRLWDVTARKKVRDIRGHSSQVYHLAFSGDGKRLYAADGNRVSVWNPATGTPLDDRGGHRYTIADAAWSPDSKRLASGAAYTDNLGRVWDPVAGRKAFDLTGHRDGIEAVAYSPDGSLLATGSQDGTVRLWDPATGKELHSFAAKDGMVYALAFTPDGRFLVTGGRKALHVWDVAGRREARTIPNPGGLVLQLTFLPGGRRVLARDYKAGVRVLDFATGREEARLAEGEAWPGDAAVSPDGRYVAHADPDGAVRLADAATGRAARLLAGPVSKEPDARDVRGVAYSPDGRTVAVAYVRGEVRVYEVATGSARFRFSGHADAPRGVRFSPDGTRLCSFGADRTLIVWDLTGERLAPAPPPKSAEAAWADLASADAAKGFAAVRHLAADPAAAVRLLGERVRPVAVADPKVITALVGKLGADEFADREAASGELAALAPAAAGQLREALGKSDSAEVRARLAALLAGVGETRLSGERLRAVRTVEVLERAGSADARSVLAGLARGAAGARLTEEAAGALGRFGRQ